MKKLKVLLNLFFLRVRPFVLPPLARISMPLAFVCSCCVVLCCRAGEWHAVALHCHSNSSGARIESNRTARRPIRLVWSGAIRPSSASLSPPLFRLITPLLTRRRRLPFTRRPASDEQQEYEPAVSYRPVSIRPQPDGSQLSSRLFSLRPSTRRPPPWT